MVKVGDIATVKSRPGYWVVMDQVVSAVPPGRVWRLQQPDTGPFGLSRSLEIGDGDITVVVSPAFVNGAKLQHWGEQVEVLSDNGATIRCRKPRARRLIGARPYGGPVYVDLGVGEIEVGRGALVAANISMLIGVST